MTTEGVPRGSQSHPSTARRSTRLESLGVGWVPFRWARRWEGWGRSEGHAAEVAASRGRPELEWVTVQLLFV